MDNGPRVRGYSGTGRGFPAEFGNPVTKGEGLCRILAFLPPTMSNVRSMSLANLRAAYIGEANEAALLKLLAWSREDVEARTLDLARTDGQYFACRFDGNEKEMREWVPMRRARAVRFSFFLLPIRSSGTPC